MKTKITYYKVVSSDNPTTIDEIYKVEGPKIFFWSKMLNKWMPSRFYSSFRQAKKVNKEFIIEIPKEELFLELLNI